MNEEKEMGNEKMKEEKMENDKEKMKEENKIMNQEKVKEIKMEEMKTEKQEKTLNEEKLESLLEEFSKDKPKYILLEKTKSLYTIMHPYLELFPKSEKFTLRQRIEETILDAIKILILQNYRETDEERKKMMLEFIANINLLEILLQQAIIFKYLSFGGYQKVLVLVREINSIALARHRNLNGGITNENL